MCVILNLTHGTSASHALTDDDYYEDDEEDDPDALKDPLYQVDLQVQAPKQAPELAACGWFGTVPVRFKSVFKRMGYGII